MDRLLESYKTLLHLGTQVRFFIEVHDSFTNNEKTLNEIKFSGHYSNLPFVKAISGSLLNYSLIIAASFVDEYNREFTASKHPKFKERIERLKLITKPAMRRINKWTNLKDYRNYILAHSFRVKGQSVFAKDFQPFHFNAPHTNSEIILLTELLKIIATCITDEFPELVDKLDWSENLLTKMTFDSTEVNIAQEITEIWTQIKSIKATD
jgi:hypothetical protein